MTNDTLVIIPAFNAVATIRTVVHDALKYADKVLVVDDGCPQRTGGYITTEFEGDNRVEVIVRAHNGGVGAAMKDGFRWALANGYCKVVKIDADGQMDCSLIPLFVAALTESRADYVKGNRFDSVEDLESMPKIRIFGNAALSLAAKFSTGYWTVNDPTNGYIAIAQDCLRKVSLNKVSDGYFFESDMLFRMGMIGASVREIPHKARYEGENSNLSIRKVLWSFPFLHLRRLIKRLAYKYIIREWSLGTLHAVSSVLLAAFGITLTILFGFESIVAQRAWTSAQTTLVSIALILSVQFNIAFWSYDIQTEPGRHKES